MHRQLETPQSLGSARCEQPLPARIHRWFEQFAAEFPDRMAVVEKERGWTYGELDARASRLADRLRSWGVEPEDRVAVVGEHSVEAVAGILAVLKAGAAYVPLDPALPRERINFVLRDAKARAILAPPHMQARLPQDAGRVGWIHTVDTAPPGGARKGIDDDDRGDRLAYVIYTSGSTGTPKGVLVTHANVVYSTAARFQYYPEPVGRFLLVSPLSFDSSVAGLFWTLSRGGTLVLPGRQWQQFPQRLPQLIARERITHLLAIPSLWSFLLRHADVEQLASLRTVIVAGEACPRQLVRRHFQTVPQARLYNEYGPTETTVWCAVHAIGPDETDQPVPIGRPITGTRIYLLDEAQRPVPEGEPGELYVASPGIARGYLDRPELSRQVFLTGPLGTITEERLYRTGDRARYLADGSLEFLGRVDHQVKIRGHRIELGEIEAALQLHPGVDEAVVVFRDNGGGPHLVAYATMAAEVAPTEQQLREFLVQRLPAVMVPTRLVAMAVLPRRPNGKVDREALPEPPPAAVNGISGNGHFRLLTAKARPPAIAAVGSTPDNEESKSLLRSATAPVGDSDNGQQRLRAAPPLRNAHERQLARLWQQLLGQPPRGPREDFFGAGGDSLQAMELLVLIERHFGRAVSMADLLRNPTLAGMAAILHRTASPHDWSPLVPLRRSAGNRDGKRPFFCVHPGNGDPLCYLELSGHFDPQRQFFALQARGVDGVRPPLESVEEMAACYLEAIRKVQPRGPYCLGGWSFGGIVAYEMACQLTQQGEHVAMLAIIDTGFVYSLAVVRTMFAKDDVPLFHLSGMSEEQQLNVFREPATIAQLIPVGASDAHARRILRIFRANVEATLRYRPPVYPGRAALFMGKDEFVRVRVRRDPHREFSELCRDGVDLHVVPGNHLNLVHKPHAQTLAAQLNAGLGEVDRQFPMQPMSPAS